MSILIGHRMEVIFALAACLVALLIWRSLKKLHRDDNVQFDLRDLLMENGKVSKAACVMMGAFAATTWFFLYYAVTGRMTEGYFGLYGGFWITPVVARLIVQAKDGVASPAVVTTETKTTLSTSP